MFVPTITYEQFLFGAISVTVGCMLAIACLLVERLWTKVKKLWDMVNKHG
jgi:hypothetical protein